jgi:Arc/MetJ family transcription regulator
MFIFLFHSNLQRLLHQKPATARYEITSDLMLLFIKSDSYSLGGNMRTTVTIDDELYAQALDIIEPNIEKSELFRLALKVFIRIESAKRLAALGGKAPKMKTIPRR